MFAEILGIEKIPVLLIEDALNEATATKHQLSQVDDEFTISSVSSLKDALGWIAQSDVDVVLLDLGLPDSTGPQSIKTLNAHFPLMPIVVLSGHDDPATIRSALEYGAEGFLSKSECSGQAIRQAILSAIIRKSLTKELSP
jgi:DNA-binding NarL/FixJ family response regulator